MSYLQPPENGRSSSVPTPAGSSSVLLPAAARVYDGYEYAGSGAEVEAGASRDGANSGSSDTFSIFTQTEKRWIMSATLYATMFAALSNFMLYPAMIPISEDLSASIQSINLTITAYFAVGAVVSGFIGDLADRVGRRPVLVLMMALYMGANIGLAAQDSYPVFLALKIVQGVGSSGALAVAYGIVADIVSPEERGSCTATLATFTYITPSVAGPIISGNITQKLGWEWTFWILTIISGIQLVLVTLLFPETSRNIVSDGSIKPPAINRPVFSLMKPYRYSSIQGSRTDSPHRKARVSDTYVGIYYILSHRSSLATIFVGSAYYIAARTLDVSLAARFMETYDLNPRKIGFIYIASGVGGLISTHVTRKLLNRDYKYMSKQTGRDPNSSTSEDGVDFPFEQARLRNIWYFILIGIGATVGYGWSLDRRTHMAVPIVMQFFTGFGMMGVFTICETLLTDLNPASYRKAQAMFSLIRGLGVGGGIAALHPLIDVLGIGWCFVIYSALCLITIPVLWLLQTRGMQWRAYTLG